MKINLSKYKDLYGNFAVGQYYLDAYGQGPQWVDVIDYKVLDFDEEGIRRICELEGCIVVSRWDAGDSKQYSILLGDVFLNGYFAPDGRTSPNIAIPYGTEVDFSNITKFLVKREPKPLGSISLVVKTMDGYNTITKKKKDKEVDIDLNYPDKVVGEYPKIVKSLNEDSTGLHVIHGIPGTGKSRFIRHLSAIIPKNFIFIPNNLFQAIDDPSFIPLLQKNEGCVLVIEDAESIIRDRKVNASNSISSLLNITDGILADILSMTVILTYNCEDELVDPALLRKGRAKSKTEFGPLSEEKAIKLANSLGKKDFEIKGEMTLGDVYNLESESFSAKKKGKMGF